MWSSDARDAYLAALEREIFDIRAALDPRAPWNEINETFEEQLHGHETWLGRYL